ncbi:CCA tRNA nucleotidyltransferase [Leptospira kobayashii]|nr:CCA tRNA nucleotidyltransferase [Leptospira kobayashii]
MPVGLTHIPEPFRSHLQVLYKTLKNADFESYLVGGSVRDLCMGKVPKEYDLTTSAKPEDVKKLFRHVIETGIQHGTVTVVMEKVNYEITTFRIDKDYTDGRRPDHVEFGSSLSEDLKRRDFTMNALALNLETDELIDEHEGQVDIRNKLIRTIGDPVKRFSEDGLRPVRAMRFASVLGFSIEPNTRKAIEITKQITAKISVERLQEEIIKSFLGPKPSEMLKLLLEEGILSLFFPNFLSENIIPQNKSLLALDSVPKENPGFILGIWMFAIFPFATTTECEDFLKKLKFSNQLTKDALFFFSICQDLAKPLPQEDYEIRKYFLAPIAKHTNPRKMEPNEVFAGLKVVISKLNDKEGIRWFEKLFTIWQSKPPLLLSELVLNGKDIETLFPSLPKQKYGELLQFLLEMVWKDPINNQTALLTEHSAYFISKL